MKAFGGTGHWHVVGKEQVPVTVQDRLGTLEGALLVFLLDLLLLMGGKLVDAITALEFREGQASADAVLHVLDLSLVGYDEY